MNFKPFVHTYVCASLLAALSLPASAQAIEVIAPLEEQLTRLVVSDPDRHVRTLGTPEITFDLSASHDDFLDLRIRRSGLHLPNGQVFTAFAVHAAHDLVVLAGGDVARIEIAGVSRSGSAREALVLFKNSYGAIIAPAPDEVAVFDTQLRSLPLSYKQAAIPQGAILPVTILLDVSGSMGAHMGDVLGATSEFLNSLPLYARCRIFTFNDQVKALPLPGNSNICASAGFALWDLPEPAGGTALLAAIDQGLRAVPADKVSSLPAITLAVTDGVDTASTHPLSSLQKLSSLKAQSGAKLFIFWAGVSDPQLLNSLADLQITSGADVKGELERFFSSLGVSLSGLQVLKVGE